MLGQPGEPGQPKVIHWSALETDDAIKSKLIDLIRDVHISSMARKTKEEVQEEIKKYFKTKGFPGADSIAIDVSEPNEAGQRMGMATVLSPISGETIDFGF